MIPSFLKAHDNTEALHDLTIDSLPNRVTEQIKCLCGLSYDFL